MEPNCVDEGTRDINSDNLPRKTRSLGQYQLSSALHSRPRAAPRCPRFYLFTYSTGTLWPNHLNLQPGASPTCDPVAGTGPRATRAGHPSCAGVPLRASRPDVRYDCETVWYRRQRLHGVGPGCRERLPEPLGRCVCLCWFVMTWLHAPRLSKLWSGYVNEGTEGMRGPEGGNTRYMYMRVQCDETVSSFNRKSGGRARVKS